MGTGRVLLCSLLILSLRLGLTGGPGAWGAPVAEEELQGTPRLQLGKDPLDPV